MVALQNYYRQKPDILLCPDAKQRRGPDAKERLVPLDSPLAVYYGGPHSCYDFPIQDATRGPGKLPQVNRRGPCNNT